MDARPDIEDVAIEDPAEYGARALKGMLEARGIVVEGKVRVDHRPSVDAKDFLKESHEPIAGNAFAAPAMSAESTKAGLKLLAEHQGSPLREDVMVTNKVSQNLHAELLLRQLGLRFGEDGSTAQGTRVVRQFLLNAGLDKDDFVFYDGSGLSGHDLVTPRATVRLLEYAAGQTWFADWRRSLPVGGVDGSLEHRFTKAPLKGHVFAKTGTLGEARALSGYVDCRSGKTVAFSIMVGNHAPGTSADRAVMDKVVEAIAELN